MLAPSRLESKGNPYQTTRPPPPNLCGSPGGPLVTGPRVTLRDGRHLAYNEYGVPRHRAKYKITTRNPFTIR
ncbi:hypothetical protein Hanom_Chr12g01103421 [Helianthus anomalus]